MLSLSAMSLHLFEKTHHDAFSLFCHPEFLKRLTVIKNIFFQVIIEAYSRNLILNPYLKAFSPPPVWFTHRTVIPNAFLQRTSLSRQKLEKGNTYNLFTRTKCGLSLLFSPYEPQNCIVYFFKFKSEKNVHSL